MGGDSAPSRKSGVPPVPPDPSLPKSAKSVELDLEADQVAAEDAEREAIQSEGGGI
jgi:hypothetical protein